jgi:hypothetical protein
MKTEFDYDSAIVWINENNFSKERHASYIYSIELLKMNQTRRFHRNKTNNRLDTNLTNLYKPLKLFTKGADELIQIDLKNSQPCFLALFLLVIILAGI